MTNSNNINSESARRPGQMLIRESSFLVASSVITAILWSAFWLVAARVCTVEDVGIATAAISALSLLILVSRMGLNFSLVRYFPDGKKNNILGTTLTVTTVMSVFAGIIFVAFAGQISSDLGLLQQQSNYLVFLFVLAAMSAVTTIGIAFVASRRSGLFLLQNTVMGSRVIFIIVLVSAGAMGIVTAFGLSILLSLAVSILLLKIIRLKISPSIDWRFLRESLPYSAANYASSILNQSPPLVIPIIALGILGPVDAAFYFVAYAIAAFLFMIPSGVSTSLFVEGSHGEDLRRITKMSVAIITLILIPACVILYFLAGKILDYIGPSYSDGAESLLRIMIWSSPFMGLVNVYTSIMRIRSSHRELITLSVLVFVLLCSLSILLTQWLGLVGLGYAWLITYLAVGLVLTYPFARQYLRGPC